MIIISPSRARLSVLAYFSHLVQTAGNLLRTTTSPYHLSNGCPSGSTPAPCTCPSGLAGTYTVSGFNALAACTTCDLSSDPPWPGTLYLSGEACLWWALSPDFNPYNIAGRSLDISYTQLLLNNTVSPCRWELYIACGGLHVPTKTLWSGYKTTGSTPIGTYAFVSSDCGNTTPTITVS